MKRGTFALASVGIWLLCLLSFLGIHFYFRNRPSNQEFILKGQAILQSLDNEEKTNIARFDSAIIRLSGERFRLIGLGHESEEKNLLEDDEISLKKLEFLIDDPVLFERQALVKEAYRTLNQAEKHCFADHYATIIYRNGEFFLCFDKKIYSEYVLKYGTECKQCDETKKGN